MTSILTPKQYLDAFSLGAYESATNRALQFLRNRDPAGAVMILESAEKIIAERRRLLGLEEPANAPR